MTNNSYHEIKSELENISNGKCVCNKSEFKWLRDRAHRLFHSELRIVIQDSEMRWINTPHWNNVDSCIKKIKSGKFAEVPKEKQLTVLAILYKWKEFTDQLKEVEPLIVNGRKVGERKTPARTLENTGTCSICDKNCKLDGTGRVVSHGFTIEYHQQNGLCFGVGYQPWELSPEGVTAFIEKCLIPKKNRLTAFSKFLVWSPKKLDSIVSAIRTTSGEIDFCQNRVAQWKKSSLPKGQS